MRRQAGTVLPLFSIRTRGDWGIGQYSAIPAAAAWIARAGQRLLQVLPPHELSPGESSPYGALSAFALDPIYLDVDAVDDLDARLVDQALGEGGKRDLARVRALPHVDYGAVRALKTRVLDVAFHRFREQHWLAGTPRAEKLAAFIRSERAWLDDLALYKTLRAAHQGWGWSTWADGERDRTPEALERARGQHAIAMERVAYVQWLLHDQWQAARAGTRAIGVELMGDLPFVVGAESADVWSRASQFQFRLSLGAPPDGFSPDGQDWGLPPYNWLAMEGDDMAWLRLRTRRAAQLYDRFRLDHVVGFFRQWIRRADGLDRGRFDPDDTSAQNARGRRALGAILSELADASGAGGEDDVDGEVEPPRAIAEDLGVIPPFVRQALNDLGMPGYRVVPWEKDGLVFRDPATFPRNSVVSWSTHDTAPIDAWWPELSAADRAVVAKRAGTNPGPEDDPGRSLALIGDMYRAPSDLALVLVQELLGNKNRINTPGTVGAENWTWRLPRPIEDLAIDPALAARFEAIRVLARGTQR